MGIAVDNQHNIYMADFGNNVIRKMSANGVMSILAGSVGVKGWEDGTGTAATFYFPKNLALDEAGNVYVTNSGDTNIRYGLVPSDPSILLSKATRKITQGGVVTTVPGASSGDAVVTDKSGNLYVATSYIRKISPSGVVTTFAGSSQQGWVDGVGTAARFWGISGLAIDDAGNIFAADSTAVRMITPDGTVTTLAGAGNDPSYADGVGSAARFGGLIGIAVDKAGNVYVADNTNSLIRKITKTGVVSTFAGTANVRTTTLGALPGTIAEPRGLAIDANGTIYFGAGNAVLKIQ